MFDLGISKLQGKVGSLALIRAICYSPTPPEVKQQLPKPGTRTMWSGPPGIS